MTYHERFKSDNPKRSIRFPLFYAEDFIDPIRQTGNMVSLVALTGISYRTLGRIVGRECTAVSVDVADRLCMALGMDFHSLRECPHYTQRQQAS